MNSQELSSNIIHSKIATTYGLIYDKNYTQYLKYVLVERFAQPEHVCLDIGIANGILAIPVSRLVKEIHGVDICPEMLVQCHLNLKRSNVKNVFIYQRSATDLPFYSETFDLVFSFSTLLLVPNPEKAFWEIHRVLKLRGLAILDITGKYNLSQVYWRKYYRRAGHFGLNAYRLSEITSYFESLGLMVLEVHPTGWLDQWKYIPGLRYLTFLEKIFHSSPHHPDLDYRMSKLFPKLANRWYFVLKKL